MRTPRLVRWGISFDVACIRLRVVLLAFQQDVCPPCFAACAACAAGQSGQAGAQSDDDSAAELLATLLNDDDTVSTVDSQPTTVNAAGELPKTRADRQRERNKRRIRAKRLNKQLQRAAALQ